MNGHFCLSKRKQGRQAWKGKIRKNIKKQARKEMYAFLHLNKKN